MRPSVPTCTSFLIIPLMFSLMLQEILYFANILCQTVHLPNTWQHFYEPSSMEPSSSVFGRSRHHRRCRCRLDHQSKEGSANHSRSLAHCAPTRSTPTSRRRLRREKNCALKERGILQNITEVMEYNEDGGVRCVSRTITDGRGRSDTAVVLRASARSTKWLLIQSQTVMSTFDGQNNADLQVHVTWL